MKVKSKTRYTVKLEDFELDAIITALEGHSVPEVTGWPILKELRQARGDEVDEKSIDFTKDSVEAIWGSEPKPTTSTANPLKSQTAEPASPFGRAADGTPYF